MMKMKTMMVVMVMIAIMHNDTCKKFLLNIINCFRDLTEIDND